MKIKTIKRTTIGGVTVHPGSILEVNDIVAVKLIRREYVEEVCDLGEWAKEMLEETEDINHEPASDK